MNEQERSFETTPDTAPGDTRKIEIPPFVFIEQDPDIERLESEGGPVMPEDDK